MNKNEPHVVAALAELAVSLGAPRWTTAEPDWEKLRLLLDERSCWLDELANTNLSNDYNDFAQAVLSRDCVRLRDWIDGVAADYLARWARLGFPTNREAWLVAYDQSR